jgi:NAD+ diphosphatase
MALDRAEKQRKAEAWLKERLEDPGSRLLAAHDAEVLLAGGGEAPALARQPLADVRLREDAELVLLGLEYGYALFAADLELLEVGSAGPVVSLREAGASLPQAEGGLAAYLVALLGWHRRHRFCANCGTPSQLTEGGYSRHCPNCGAIHFPRLDPVVIMLVESDARLLLGRRPNWPERRYSALAGFVSPGEAVEEAVVREVFEESGIVARAPRSVASQPWPFPSSLMLGFHARADGGEPFARDGELEDVRWFSADTVAAALAGDEDGELLLPPKIAIARFLIDRWMESRDGR